MIHPARCFFNLPPGPVAASEIPGSSKDIFRVLKKKKKKMLVFMNPYI